MTLNKFISYCHLSGIITRRKQIDARTQKVIISRLRVHAEILYWTAGDGEIIKCHLITGPQVHPEPTLENLVSAFFPVEKDETA